MAEIWVCQVGYNQQMKWESLGKRWSVNSVQVDGLSVYEVDKLECDREGVSEWESNDR